MINAENFFLDSVGCLNRARFGLKEDFSFDSKNRIIPWSSNHRSRLAHENSFIFFGSFQSFQFSR